VVFSGIVMAACSSGSARQRLVVTTVSPLPPEPDTTPSPPDAGADAGDASDGRDAAGENASIFACAGPQDCEPHVPQGPLIFCCIHGVCIDGVAAEAQTCSDAAAQNVQASSYDQSCQADSDCVEVKEGNFCNPGANNGFTNTAIAKSAYPQYQADLAKTQAAVCVGIAGCLFSFAPRCVNGSCVAGGITVVPLPSDASANTADVSAEATSSEAGDAGTE